MTTEQRPARPRRSDAIPATAEEVFLSHSMGEEKIVSRQMTSDGGMVQYTHTSASKRVLYAPATWGWESREVPASNVPMLLGAGMKVVCGDCNGNCSPDPMAPEYNNCPGRPKFATARCPVCLRVFHDFGARVIPEHLNVLTPLDETRDTEINQDVYSAATPAARLKSMTDQHILAYHSSDAAVLGLTAPDPRLQDPRRG